MQHWDVVAVITALVGLFATVLGPIVKLTKAITRLTAAMERMERDVMDLTTKNHAGHERLWVHAREQDKQLSDHESRIRVIEGDR